MKTIKENLSSLTPLLIAVSVFSILVVGLWFGLMRQGESVAAWLGAGYALLCFGFLIFQMVAFVRAHVAYDQSVEDSKFDPILTEEAEWDA